MTMKHIMSGLDNNNEKKNVRVGKGAMTVAIAVVVVALVGMLPLERMSDGKLKDFNLFSDIMPEKSDIEEAPEIIDIEEEQPIDGDINDGAVEIGDALGARGETSEAESPVSDVVPAAKPSKVGELVVIEDYTSHQNGLRRLRAKLNSGQLARIAVVGDSYIEGDIMTQDLRAMLQSHYGGSGVGYMNLHSDFPGFRRSITQGGKGWKNYTATQRGKQQYMGLSEQYSQSEGNGTATYKGTKKIANADKWTSTRILAIAPQGGVVATKGTGAEEWESHRLEASESVQMIKIDGVQSELSLKTSDTSVILLGVWLDGDRGVSLDCMSSRGIPGYSLAKLSPDLSAEMRKYIDYDLIVLEFGINAMSAKQTNYSAFTKNMVKVVDNLRKCYPNAEILLLGVGDRGEKRGGAYHSMSTIENMIAAQRDAARQSHTMFWDTREAMGGDDAIVDWSKTGKANKDYVHLTHKGGEALAQSLYDALNKSMQ